METLNTTDNKLAHAAETVPGRVTSTRLPFKIYLSGPMSGLQNFNADAFNDAAHRLRASGLLVVNPVELCKQGSAWNECMREDIKALCDCCAIALLPGWEASQGAHLELHIAHRLGLQILRVEDLL